MQDESKYNQSITLYVYAHFNNTNLYIDICYKEHLQLEFNEINSKFNKNLLI
jgi:hypothetical protein